MKTYYIIMVLLLLCFTVNCVGLMTSKQTTTDSSITNRPQYNLSGMDYKIHKSMVHTPFKHWNTWMKQDIKPVKPGVNLNSDERPSISILVNGSESTTITASQDIVMTVTFSTGVTQAIYSLWLDFNSNGQLDDNIDIMIESPVSFTDNDFYDENPMIGVYEITSSGEEDGPYGVANLYLLFKAEDSGGADTAALHILPAVTSYSIAGSITPALSTLIVMASPVGTEDETYMASSNSNGTYTLYVPQSGNYNVMCFDPLNLTEGMVCLTEYENLFINGHLTGYNFVFVEPPCSISGYVHNQDNEPVPNINVYVSPESGGAEFGDVTDENGYYHVGVVSGTYHMSIDTNPDLNNYLQINEFMIIVDEDEDLTHDFIVYETDGIIQGSTYLDGQLTSQLPIRSDSFYGSSYTYSNMNGNYFLKVSTLANATGGNYVYVPSWDLPSNMYCTDSYQGVFAGAADIDFNVYIASGALEGHVYNSVTSQPVNGNAWVNASSNMLNYYSGINDEGFYHISLPPGTYLVSGGGNAYYNSTAQTIIIGTSVLTMNINLTPVVFSGSIYGYAYDTQTSLPIPGVNINVNTMNYGQDTTTDGLGYYSIQLPNGTFSLNANVPDYQNEFTDNLVIQDNNLLHNIYMTPSVGVNDPNNPTPVNQVSLSNYPNPFNPETTISFNLPSAMNVTLDILNVRGQLVKTLTSEQYSSGIHNVTWNGKDNNGKQLASGVYLYRITTPIKTITNKMLMQK